MRAVSGVSAKARQIDSCWAEHYHAQHENTDRVVAKPRTRRGQARLASRGKRFAYPKVPRPVRDDLARKARHVARGIATWTNLELMETSAPEECQFFWESAESRPEGKSSGTYVPELCWEVVCSAMEDWEERQLASGN